MKTVKNYLFALLSLVLMFSITACQSEEEMEERLLNGYCWEGQLPIESYNDYYSRFYFETDGTGVEEVYRNGKYSGEYDFVWGWRNDSSGVLELTYRSGRYTSGSCIVVLHVSKSKLDGYFYENSQDYWYDMNYNGYPNEDYRFILTSRSGTHRYNN